MLSWEDGDPNVADDIDQTPVHVAARCGNVRCLRLLLSKGGRIDSEDINGKTPIELATDQCKETIIQYQFTTMFEKEFSKLYMKELERLQRSKGKVKGKVGNDDHTFLAAELRRA